MPPPSDAPGAATAGLRPVAEVPVVSVPRPTRDEVEEASSGLDQGLALLGINQKVRIDPSRDGVWETSASGESVWRVAISSPGAPFIVPAFGVFRIAEGRVRVYASDAVPTGEVQSFTSADVTRAGTLWTAPVRGESMVVEYVGSSADGLAGQLEINTVTHGIADLDTWMAKAGADSALGTSAAAASGCLDVNCDSGSTAQLVKKGVAFVAVSATNFQGASGSLINNERGDCKRYFLTAQHVVPSIISPASATFYFGYERPGCGPGVAPTSMSSTGSTQRASWARGCEKCNCTSGGSDFTLLELNSIPAAYAPRMNGWARTAAGSTYSFTMHHPNNQPKELAVDDDALTSFSSIWWRSGDPDGYESGRTGNGSSGAPLFNDAARIIGQLCGGSTDASCPGNILDYWGKVNHSWNGNGTAATRLRTWLDPDATGVASIAGKGCGPQTMVVDGAVEASLQSVADPALGADVRVLSTRIQLAGQASQLAETLSHQAWGVTPGVTMSRLSGSRAAALGLAPDLLHTEIEVEPSVPCGATFEVASGLVESGAPTTSYGTVMLRNGSAQTEDLRTATFAAGTLSSTHPGWQADAAAGPARFSGGADADQSVLDFAPFAEVPAAATLRFQHRFRSENFYDGAVLEVAVDGGPWEDAARFISEGGYTSTVSGKADSSLAGRNAWAGDSGGWRQVLVDLDTLAGHEVRFRLVIASDRSNGALGWEIDRVTLQRVAYDCSTGAIEVVDTAR